MRLTTFLLALAGLAISLSANATLIGDTVHGLYKLNPDVLVGGPDPAPDPFPENRFETLYGGSGETAVVGSGTEFVNDGGKFRIYADLSSDKLILDYDWDGPTPGPLGPLIPTYLDHYLLFSDLDWSGAPGTIVGFNLVAGTTPALEDYYHTADSLFVEFDAITGSTAGSFHLEFDIEVEHASTDPVPEPATVTLLGLGLLGMAYRRKTA